MKKILFIAALFTSAAVKGQNTLKVTAGATLKTTGGAVITVENMHLDNDGTINQVAGEGTFRFSGNTNTNISGTAIPLFDRLEMAKINAQLLLMGNINITSAIDFNSGLLNLNNYNILLQPAALLNGESELSRIIGTGGYVEITNTLNAPSFVNPGNLGAVFTSLQNFGSTTIRRGHASQTGATGMGGSILRYYDILPANNNALNVTLRFNYFDAELNGFDENTMVLWKSHDNINWIIKGFTSRNATANYVERTGIPNFSRWTLSSPGTVFAKLNQHRMDSTTADYTALSNSFNNHVLINMAVSTASNATTMLFDSKGALIRTRQDRLVPGNNTLDMDISDLPAGIYYVLTEWANGHAKRSARFVKLY